MQKIRIALVAIACAAAQSCTPAAEAPPARQPDPEAGRTLVQTACATCHGVNLIERSAGYSRAHWAELVATMIALPEAQREPILDYLEASFPPSRNTRTARRADGPLNVAFTEWVAPQLGERTRDPVEAPDGSIWWVGQRGNFIGRLDPRTGAMQEWPLPEGALPHSVNVDAQGGVWYMGNGNATIGRFDPQTGRATEYPMPNPAARDPHTAEFDANGILWFTLQQSNMIGRFDPRTGAIRLATIATPRARPYGIRIAADGAPWVACNGAACIIRVDPRTMALREIRLPGEGTHARRLDIASDGTIWYVNSGRGRLGRYVPESGEIREWDSPSGPASHPYAIAVIDDIVWYNESGVRPDMLVRFDPQTERFQSWPIPSGNVYAGIVRHMRADRAGNLLLHQGSTNRIIRARLPPAR